MLRPLHQIMLLVLVTLGYHAWNLGGDYVYDDFIYIVMNPAVQSGLADWTRFFTDRSTYSWLPSSHYRPLVTLSYAANAAMGLDIFGFKLTQALLHLATVLGLFRLVQLMSGHLRKHLAGLPFAVAALFAILPFNVEAVHYLTARSAVMCGLFSVLSLVLYLEMRRSQRPLTVGMLYLAHLAAMGVALLSKETTLTLPGVVFLMDLLVVSGGIAVGTRQRALRFWWPYVPYVIGLGVVLVIMPNASHTLVYFSQVFGEEWRFAAAIYCLIENIRLMVIPTGLTIAHPINGAGRLTDPLTIACGVLVVSLLGLAVASWRRAPLLGLGLLWYFLSIAPSTFVHLNTVLLENRGYTASMGISLAFGWLICTLWQRLPAYRRPLTVALVVVALLYALVGYQRQQVWHSNLAVWQDAVAHDPASDDAVLNLGVRYVLADRLEEAEEMFTLLVRRSPEKLAPRQNLGRVYLLTGRYQAALDLLEPLAISRPKDPDPLSQLAQTYAAMGKNEAAIDMFRRAINAERGNVARRPFVHEVVPGFLEEKLLDVSLKMRRPADAVWAIEQLDAAFPNHPRGHLLRLKYFAAAGDWVRAEAALSALGRAMPNDPRLAAWREQFAAMQSRGMGRTP
jgi:protein involved in temperature-dependent protein secretion